ncbi:hypothetical protein H5T55_02290 [Candidatus Bipolaricaulota bacterium]|nr:hypothetical protein [Candidatus Bipolaricaulota bacterium]
MIPLYAARALSESDGAGLIEHVSRCTVCQTELVEAMQLGHELRATFGRLPGAPEGTWLSVAARTVGMPLLQVDLGSEMAGLSLNVGATRTGTPITGSLSILGREVPVLRI